MNYGEKLRLLRRRRGISQTQFAEDLQRLGVPATRDTIAKWEAAKNYPTFPTAIAMAKYFYVTLDNIFIDSEKLPINSIRKLIDITN